MSFEGLALRRISRSLAESYAAFDCGRSELNEFLLDEALDYDEHGLTTTTLVYDEGEACPVAYFSLSSDAIKLTTSEAGDMGLPFAPRISFFPAVKITRFAVLSRRQGTGLGRHLVNLIEGMVWHESVAVRLLTVDAVNAEPVLRFYEAAGFRASLNSERRRGSATVPDTIHMFKDIFADT